ncbi:ABC transporter ATP-binding protein [Tindallia californiensis]|uniref:Iron complex transport system ATP-binding protein n=1 Tax=Tindallia californiensis TaxID=159292 RepID=A0A1H3IA43_9FIRM|nr:ABC transporter ATP-binding protein [Tindallia californiensis]SDY24335.1 iron complex transport system ATP-binding protein [Tindallia californiensis]
MGTMVEVKELTFAYDKKIILRALNLLITEGTFLSIIGPNGSGKTTLLKNIAKNLSPTTGSIMIDGENIELYPVKKLARKIAAVHQNPDINHQFCVQDIVMMGRHSYIKRLRAETEKDIEIVNMAMQETHVFHLRDRYVNELSGGEKQRVMIAKAIAQEPDVLLLDEPISFLDIHHQIEVLELLKKLNKEKKISVIVILHDLNMAARYSEEMLLLYRGDILTLGRTEEVLTVENLKKAYELEMVIDRNIYTGCLQVSPISTLEKKSKVKKLKVHIICGGGTGKILIQRLYQEGFALSVGVVNRGDSDWEVSTKLTLDVIEEKPFEAISEKSLLLALKSAKNADVVILTSIPFGKGNLENLKIAEQQVANKKPIIFLDQYPAGTLVDFVEGEGLRRLAFLLENGMIRVTDCEEIIHQLEVILNEK